VPSAGDLRDRVAFDKEVAGDDTYGNTVTGFAEQFAVAAQIRFLRGTEPVIAQRLQGVQPAVITVRASADTKQVDASWRARDTRTGAIFNIRSVTPSDDRAWIDLLCEAGRG
jgi:SPP1 family predicted phage head-tail adaptor